MCPVNPAALCACKGPSPFPMVAEGLAVSRPAVTTSGIEVCEDHNDKLASGKIMVASQWDGVVGPVAILRWASWSTYGG
jgi:hypothetical protein